MPSMKPKPSDIAIEAKRKWLPYIERELPHLKAPSVLYSPPGKAYVSTKGPSGKLRVAVIKGDPVDVALDWNQVEGRNRRSDRETICTLEETRKLRIPLVVPVDEKRPGGDWESGSLAPEENLARRSNLVHTLKAGSSDQQNANYPIPFHGGIYCPSVVVFRSGYEAGYGVWSDPSWLPVVAVPPVRRPKLDDSGEDYSFAQEKELMKEKIRIVLRIAGAERYHRDVCIGAFGAGGGFRNPAKQLARMWKDVLFGEDEFKGFFSNIVFAIEETPSHLPQPKPSDFEIFKQEFDPSNVCKTEFR